MQYKDDGSDADLPKVINNPSVMGGLNMELQNEAYNWEAFKGGCPGLSRPVLATYEVG